MTKCAQGFMVEELTFGHLFQMYTVFFVSGDVLMLELMYLSNWIQIQLARLSLLKLPITFLRCTY